MGNLTSFFWYDLETFGLNPFYDRIAQFAGQRTDIDLNPIGDPVILYCRLSADYLPDPGACIVTGITPQEVKQKGIPESEFIEKINALFSVPGTCVCGFNTLKFDDEFIRNALYRNFLDPYEREWKNSCTRWDIIDLVRATHDFRPQGIEWPKANEENGNPVFRLTEMTAANKIEQIGAHDAMVDVNATIAVAKLIKEKQPKIFEHYLKMRSKVEVKNLLNIQGDIKPILHTNTFFTNPKGCTAMVVPITPKTDQDNCVICFNLSKDPAPLISSDSASVWKTAGLLKIQINKVPFVAPCNTLSDEDYTRLGIDKRLCLEHYKLIMDNIASIIQKLRTAEDKPEYEQSDDPDFSIYSKFFTDGDKALFSVIRNTPAEQRLNLNLKFTDSRCPEMLWRHVCRNYPEVLSGDEQKKWKAFATSRILCPPGNPINDIYFVERKIDEKLKSKEFDEKQKNTLSQLKEYLVSLKRYLGLKEITSDGKA